MASIIYILEIKMKNRRYLFIFSIIAICLIFLSSFNFATSIGISTNKKGNRNDLTASLFDNIIFVEAGEKISIKIIDDGDFDFTKLLVITDPATLFLDYENETKILDDGKELIVTSFLTLNPFRLIINYDGSQILDLVVLKNLNGFEVLSEPIARFTHNKNDLKLSFDASESYDPDGGNINYYLWDFGDGTLSLSDESTKTHTFQEDKEYSVSLTVVDDEGAGHTSTKKVNKKSRELNLFKILFNNFYELLINLKLINFYPTTI